MALFRHSVRRHEEAALGALAATPHALDSVRIGAYLHSDRDLYRVEGVSGGRALMEDCRSGKLIDVPLSELLTLEPVRVTEDGAPDTTS
jgi:hypothetical protein